SEGAESRFRQGDVGVGQDAEGRRHGAESDGRLLRYTGVRRRRIQRGRLRPLRTEPPRRAHAPFTEFTHPPSSLDTCCGWARNAPLSSPYVRAAFREFIRA